MHLETNGIFTRVIMSGHTALQPMMEAARTGQGNHSFATLHGASLALYATGRDDDDGVIDPRDTRAVLAKVPATCREADAREPQRMQFSVARP